MRIGIIGAGRIGGGVAAQLGGAGHQLKLSFSRDPAALGKLALQIGPGATTGSPAEAVEFGEVVVISVPWSVLPQALDQAEGQTAAQFNAARMPGAHYTKSFNTLTSAFQAVAAGRHGDERVVQWLCGDSPDARRIVAGLVEDAGFIPVDLGGTADCAVMESPRREGAVYGEEYRAADAKAVVEAVRAGRPIPATPRYP